MMMDSFKADIEAFLERVGMSPSRFGRCFLNDPGFVYRLRAGGECRPSTMDRVRNRMAEVDAHQNSREAS